MNSELKSVLSVLGLKQVNAGTWEGDRIYHSRKYIESRSPVDGNVIARVSVTGKSGYDNVLTSASEAFHQWKLVPAPRRGEMVRLFAEKLRELKDPIGRLVSWEMGKSLQEGLGEVQEMIDICDFAVGLSRQLHGLTMHSERPMHRMYEQYHPLGIVGIISAFNFPVAVWSWNAALAWICGNVTVWKPSEKVPICALACQNVVGKILKENGLPSGISTLVNGDLHVGKWLASDRRISLISATGSTRMGREVGEAVARRLGRSLLELGGNNAVIITAAADLDMAIRAVVFGAIGTAGQRCTSTRRVIVQQSVYSDFRKRLKATYARLSIGNPLDNQNQLGPLIDKAAVAMYSEAIRKIKGQGGKTVVEGGVLKGKGFESGCYVRPAIFEVDHDLPMVGEETFAPILYLIKYKTLDEAIRIQNEVRQGLSSSIMTKNLREAEQYLSVSGSDCGIANVNIGTSGAEIGGAFGGEKDTGGGRESGSDAWRNYMRRQTNTINYSDELPLAQGIRFDL